MRVHCLMAMVVIVAALGGGLLAVPAIPVSAESGRPPRISISPTPTGNGWLIVWRDDEPFNCVRTSLTGSSPSVRMWRPPQDGRRWGLEVRNIMGQRLSVLGDVPSPAGSMPAICRFRAPTPTPTPRSPIPPWMPPEREWDARLDELGVRVIEPPLRSGSVYWRLMRATYESEEEAGGRHHIYIRLLDERGEATGGVVIVSWDNGWEAFSMDYGRGPTHYVDKYAQFGANFPMYAALGSYSAACEGVSDRIVGMGMTNMRHVNYLLVFQRIVVP